MANNTIQIKRTSVSGRAANTTTLPNPGELALNMADGIMYSTNGSVIFEIGANNTTVNVSNSITLQSNLNMVSPDGNNTITVNMLNSDTLSFSGNTGQLFSITDSQNGVIFAVNDISGVPSIEVDDDGTIRLAETFGNVLIGTNVDNGSDKLQVSGNASISGALALSSLNAGGSLGAAGQLLSVDANGDIFWSDVQETNVLYVSKNGSDTDNGTANRTYLTIKEALSNATAGDTIKISSGTYTEDNPLEVPALVSVIGDSLRNVTVLPSNTTADVFWLNNGSYVTEITIKDYVAPAAAFAFPSGGAGAITRSPYVLNCTSLTTDGIGLLVDGDKATGNRSIIAGLYTIINQGGIGVKITNRGYSQLVNIYTICTDVGVLAEQGGFCTLNCSDNSFGNYGLIANGTSTALYSGNSLGDDQFGNEIVITGLSQTPYINNVLKISGDTNYYTVVGVTPLSSNTSTVTVQERISAPVANNTSIEFFQRSYIAAAGHAFEYVGTGTNIANASPFAGGIVNSNNQAISVNGGVVNYTSTDQFGNFNINNNLSINGINATIQGDAFQRSLFGLMTPYILAIEG